METSETTKKPRVPPPIQGAKRAAQIHFVGAILGKTGVTLPSRLLLILIPRAVTDDVAGAALGFHVDLADVLADHAQADQLYAGNKADDAGHAGPAGYGGTQQRFHNGPDHADKAFYFSLYRLILFIRYSRAFGGLRFFADQGSLEIDYSSSFLWLLHAFSISSQSSSAPTPGVSGTVIIPFSIGSLPTIGS